MMLYEGDIPKEVTTQNKKGNPGKSPYYIKCQKTRVLHTSDAGHERGEGADDGDESRNRTTFYPNYFSRKPKENQALSYFG